MESDGLRVAIKAKTAPGAKGLFKAYGAWWNQEVRAWLFKPEGALKLASYLAANPKAIQTDLKTDNASKFIYWGVKKNIKPGRFSADLDIRLFNLNNRFTVLILGGFDRVLHEHITSTLRGTFNPKYEAYIIDGHPQEIVETLRQAHVYPDDVYVNRNVFPTIDIASWRDVPQARLTLGSQDELDPSNLKEEDDPDSAVVTLLHEIAQKPLEKQEINPDLLVWAERKFSLREYQTQGVQHLLESNASLLADDMGLGKTRQSIVAAFIKYQGGVNVCVVPAYLKINWSREIRSLDPKGEIWLPGEYAVDGIRQNQEAYLNGTLNPKWVILSYESMGFILRFLKEKQLNLDTNIFDEAHYLKEASSQRTQKGFELASLATNRILLTGTPVLNRVSEGRGGAGAGELSNGFFGVLLTGSDAPHKLGDRSGCPKMPRGRPPRRAPRPLSAPSPPHHDPHPRAQGRPVSEYGNEQRGSYPFEGPVDEVRNKKKNRNVLLPETSIKSSPLIGRIRKIIIMKRSRLNDI